MDNGVRKFVTNAQDTSKAVCGSCGFTTSINSLIAQEIQEISLEDLT